MGSFGKELGEGESPCHLVDLRNHGKSFHADENSHDDMVEDILNYMNFHKIEKTNLLGHSLGGKAVMQFALTYPEKVAKLIVVDIAPKAYLPHHQGIIKALESVDFDKVTSRQEVEEILAQYIPEKSVIQFLTKNLYWKEDTQQKNWHGVSISKPYPKNIVILLETPLNSVFLKVKLCLLPVKNPTTFYHKMNS